MPHLFCFGLGYCAREIAQRLAAQGWQVSGTKRKPTGDVTAVRVLAYEALQASDLEGVTHVLSSIPTMADLPGDPVLAHYGASLKECESIRWLGYFSTTGVYGDYAGAWVDEASALRGDNDRLLRRIAAEKEWVLRGANVFRLSGIYGPGRSAIDDVAAHTAQRIDKPGQIFSRIHRDDVASAVQESIAAQTRGEIFNVCDDEPAASADVVTYACELLGVAPPPLVPFEKAALSPMAREFYQANRRVSNAKLKTMLGWQPTYPSYREGLRAIIAQGKMQA